MDWATVMTLGVELISSDAVFANVPGSRRAESTDVMNLPAGKKLWKAKSIRGTRREAERGLAAPVAEVPSAQPAAPARTFGELLERGSTHGRATGRPPLRSRPIGSSTVSLKVWPIAGSARSVSTTLTGSPPPYC